MKWWSKLAIVAVSAVLIWLTVMSGLSLFANGTFYHIDQPISVQEVREGEIVLAVSRSSRIDRAAICSRELQCDIMHQFPDRDCPIERGHTTFTVVLPVPEGARGECVYRGIVSYRPFGLLGPDLSYAWKTEPFTVER